MIARMRPGPNPHLTRAYDRYRELGVDVDPERPLSFETFDRILEKVEPHLRTASWRLAPTSFDPTNPALRAFPRRTSWRWKSLEDLFTTFGAQTVLMRAPLFWQVESTLHAACRRAGASLYINEPENAPVGAASVRLALVNTVVTSAEHAESFGLFLSNAQIAPPPLWVVIQPAIQQTVDLSKTFALSPQAAVAQELHLFPGVPLLTQCLHLAYKKNSVLFHASDEFEWGTIEDRAVITSTTDDPIPLARFELPFPVRNETVSCACGKPLVSKQP